MRRGIFVWVALFMVAILFSCGSEPKFTDTNKANSENSILQQEDGTIALKMDNAECYSDMVNPSSNTAEWRVLVSKSGRFNVWLSSATKDTNDLHYKNSVMLSIHDKRLEAHPVCDRVIHNSSEVAYPYFRADSFMGSLYIQDTGICSIQIISEKIIPKDYKSEELSSLDNSKLLSVILTPATR